MGRGLKIEGVKILRFVDKSGKGDRKMVVLGGLQELKAYFAPSFGNIDDETADFSPGLGLRGILNIESRVSSLGWVGGIGILNTLSRSDWLGIKRGNRSKPKRSHL